MAHGLIGHLRALGLLGRRDTVRLERRADPRAYWGPYPIRGMGTLAEVDAGLKPVVGE